MTTRATVDDVTTWLERQGSTHFGANAKLYRTALARFTQYRVDGEPDTLEWTDQNLDTLAERMAKGEHVAPNSLKTYLSRARSALSAYSDWSKNPVGWSPGKKSANGGGTARKRARAQKQESPTKPGNEAPLPAAPAEKDRTLQDEISEALVAIAKWPSLRAFLMQGLTEAMAAAQKSKI